jgi:hypothetical protein
MIRLFDSTTSTQQDEGPLTGRDGSQWHVSDKIQHSTAQCSTAQCSLYAVGSLNLGEASWAAQLVDRAKEDPCGGCRALQEASGWAQEEEQERGVRQCMRACVSRRSGHGARRYGR